MSLTVIILIVLTGFLLVFLELLVVPGITVAGIGGLILLGVGIYLAYANLEPIPAHSILAGTVVLSIVSLIFVFRSATWKKVTLHEAISGRSGKTLNQEDIGVKVGDEGVAVSRLAPMGKVEVNGEYFEAECRNKLIYPNTEIIVTYIKDKKLIVKPKNNEND